VRTRFACMCTSVDNPPVATAPCSLFTVGAYEGWLEVVDRLAEEWRCLCAEAEEDQPFYRPEWIQAHIRAFIPSSKILLISVRRGGRLRFILPLVEEKGMVGGVPVRMLRAPVNAHGGRFDAVRSLGSDGDGAIQAAWDYLKNREGWDLLQLRSALEGSTVSQLAAAAREDGFPTVQVPERPCPYVPVPAELELVNRLPANSKLRSQLRQARCRLAEQGPLSFYRVQTADREALERFYRLEASGWKGRQGSAILCNTETRCFYDEMAESAARFGYFSLYMLEFKDQLIAAHYSFTLCGRCYSPKIAYDEHFKQFAPGHLIVEEILRDCAARGTRVFDITGPNDNWKMKWTSETRPVNHYLIFRGTLGRFAHISRYKIGTALARLLRGARKAP